MHQRLVQGRSWKHWGNLSLYRSIRNLENRRYHSGALIYVNNVLMNFYRRRKNTVESSSFGSDFAALRISTDVVEALRYTLSKFGVNLEGPAEV